MDSVTGPGRIDDRVVYSSCSLYGWKIATRKATRHMVCLKLLYSANGLEMTRIMLFQKPHLCQDCILLTNLGSIILDYNAA